MPVPGAVIPGGLNIPTSLPTAPGRKSPLSPFGGAGSSLTGVAQPVAPGTTVPGTEGKGFGLSPGPGQADPASAQRAAQGAAAQNLLGRMSTPERQFPVSPIEGGGTGPGQADPMQTAIARAGGATNGFGYGR